VRKLVKTVSVISRIDGHMTTGGDWELLRSSSGSFLAASNAALTSPVFEGKVSWAFHNHDQPSLHDHPAIMSIPSHMVPYASRPARMTLTFVMRASSSSDGGASSVSEKDEA
jgi:hypothetical protein